MREHRSSQTGFTLVELVVVIAILALVVGLGAAALEKLLLRSKLESIARETQTLFQVARFEAIKRNQPAVVGVDVRNGVAAGTNEVAAFIDADGDLLHDANEIVLGNYGLPSFVELGGPNPDNEKAEDLTSSPTPGALALAVFEVDGSIRDIGAYRLMHRRGSCPASNWEECNYLELRIQPAATARVTLRKWDVDEAAWLEQGEQGKSWDWHYKL